MKKNAKKGMKNDLITIIVSLIAVAIIILGIKYILKSKEEIKEKKDVLINCEYDGKISLGSTYEQEGYLYTYIELEDEDNMIKGWNIKYTNTYSKNPTIAPTCGTIGGEPIISTSHMYSFAEAESIDVSGLRTDNVIDMTGMFEYEAAKKIIGLDKLNTKSVKNMSGMFFRSGAEYLDLRSFNTANVTNMSSMFEGAEALNIDVTSFNTKKVLNMNSMFKNIDVEDINVSSFDISETLDMAHIFDGCNATVYIGDKYTEADWRIKVDNQYQ